ncbi:hypothetical protein LTR78_002463 [Recurvomyces mirabilis]|uniref:AAA+ ATPase domain-containing protein n=1 Tax=Recurvomyces mirabilis TaxID=574656 RepID=A0AAE0WTP2_9PEZI|nr:hypothetical protein LTR78_002463 [Recurvomyces mirabilis]KAK5157392.1 hypothetical protein LTS14_004157 [Recurvomyces mirabilis]
MPKPSSADTCLLRPTLHVEVAATALPNKIDELDKLRGDLRVWFAKTHESVTLGRTALPKEIYGLPLVTQVDVADYTGPIHGTGYHNVHDLDLDLQVYVLRPEDSSDGRRTIAQNSDAHMPQARIIALPNAALKDEWDSLVFEDALPPRLLRYLTRMVTMMKQQGLNLATFNWNRLCLLHGPPGSGKSTLCRALAQKLSIRLGGTFTKSVLIEINTNGMLSKYFGESGKLITNTFDNICTTAADSRTLVCVVMDEIETIAGRREGATSGGECADGLRATNQLLTALDRIRRLPNVLVLCTSNLISEIDQAFLDRVDIKQHIPSPSAEAVYEILRSCLNEMIRITLIDMPIVPKKASKKRKGGTDAKSDEPWTKVTTTGVPTFSETQLYHLSDVQSAGARVWSIAQQCQGFSGRTLRRLPILGLAMYTWGGQISLQDAISALEAAVEQELRVKVNTNGSKNGNAEGEDALMGDL